MGETNPAILWYDLHQFLLDFLWRIALGQAEAAGDSKDVRIDDHPFGFAEADAEDDVGGFASCAGEGDELSEGFGDLAGEVGDDFAGRALNGFGLVAEEAGGLDYFLDLDECGLRHFLLSGEAAEELGGHHVDADVSALGGEDCGYEQFPGGRVGESALDAGIGFVEGFEDGGDAVGGQVATH